jgi:hypothetical protein
MILKLVVNPSLVELIEVHANLKELGEFEKKLKTKKN